MSNPLISCELQGALAWGEQLGEKPGEAYADEKGLTGISLQPFSSFSVSGVKSNGAQTASADDTETSPAQ